MCGAWLCLQHGRGRGHGTGTHGSHPRPRPAVAQGRGATAGNRLPPGCHGTEHPAVAASPPLALHPDRLLPPDPGVRAVARRLYAAVRELPIVSPHGHVDARILADDVPFPDPASLLVTPDHYVTRLLHAAGVPLAELGVGRTDLDEAGSRRVWRLLCEHWPVFRGTPSRFWLE